MIINNIKLVFALFLIIGLTSVSKAQQLEQTNLYSFNKYSLNPAFTGYNKCLEVNLGHMSQWIGISGAPQNSYLNIHGEVLKNFGLGGAFGYNQIGSFQQIKGSVSGAYQVNFNETSNIRFGISGSLLQSRVDLSNSFYEAADDPVVLNGLSDGIAFTGNAGLVLNINRFQLSAALPQVIGTRANLQSSDVGDYSFGKQLLVYGEYGIKAGEKLMITPSALFRSSASSKLVPQTNQYEGNLMFTFNDKINIGAGYRHEAGIVGRVGFVTDVIRFAYAYEFLTTDLSQSSSGSHEVMIGFRLCSKAQKRDEGIEVDEIPEDKKETKADKKADKKANEKANADTLVQVKSDTIYIEREVVIKDTVYVINNVSEATIKNDGATVLFGLNMRDLGTISSSEELKNCIDYLKANPQQKAEVIGHTCDLGSQYIKDKLSVERSAAVYRYMVQKGVKPSQLTKVAMADKQPVAKNTTEDLRKLNRRVEVKFK